LIETKSPLQKVLFREKTYFIKRDDLLDNHFSGNKARKFHYYLNYNFKNISKIISHGSSQSNAMYSLSVLAKIKNIEFIYYVDHIALFLKQNPHGNYKYALQNGMKIIEGDLKKIVDEDELFIPEGGHFKEAEVGIKILANELKEFDCDIFLPSGTGTTALYLQKHLKNRVFTCACVGDVKYLKKQFLELESDERLHPNILTLDKKYHFGKLYREFFEIWVELKRETNIEFDFLYDPLGWMNVIKHHNLFNNDLIYLHQGGIIGNESMSLRYKRKFSENSRK